MVDVLNWYGFHAGTTPMKASSPLAAPEKITCQGMPMLQLDTLHVLSCIRAISVPSLGNWVIIPGSALSRSKAGRRPCQAGGRIISLAKCGWDNANLLFTALAVKKLALHIVTSARSKTRWRFCLAREQYVCDLLYLVCSYLCFYHRSPCSPMISPCCPNVRTLVGECLTNKHQ